MSKILDYKGDTLYILSAKLPESGRCFAKIRFDDKKLADMIQEYCGAYTTRDAAQEAMDALLDKVLEYLEEAYPVTNIGSSEHFNYRIFMRESEMCIALCWNPEIDFTLPAFVMGAPEKSSILVLNVTEYNADIAINGDEESISEINAIVEKIDKNHEWDDFFRFARQYLDQLKDSSS